MRRRDEMMPAGSAGLMRFFREETHGIKISPRTVMYFAAGIIIFEILLRFWNPVL